MRWHHVVGQPLAQSLTQRADHGVGVGVVGVGGALAWPRRRQVDVGQRGVGRSSDEDGIEGAGLGAPGDGDAVSGDFAEAVQLLGGGGVGVAAASASASASDSPAARACSMWTSATSPARGMSVTRTAAGRWDVNWGAVRCRPSHSVHVQVGALASERTGARRLVDDDVVAVPGQFVVGRSAFDLDVESGH